MLRNAELFALVMVGTLATYGCQTTGSTARDPGVQEPAVQSSSFSKHAIVRIYDGVLQFPAPVWADNALTTLKLSKALSDHKGTSFVLKLIQKNEDFDRWNRFYTLHGTRDPRMAKMGLEVYPAVAFRDLLTRCPEDARGLVELASGESGPSTFVFICGNTAQWADGHGLGAEVGYVAIVRFLKFEKTLVAATFAWNVPSFRSRALAAPARLEDLSWMSYFDELIVMAERFRELNMVDPQQYEFQEVPLMGNSQASAR